MRENHPKYLTKPVEFWSFWGQNREMVSRIIKKALGFSLKVTRCFALSENLIKPCKNKVSERPLGCHVGPPSQAAPSKWCHRNDAIEIEMMASEWYEESEAFLICIIIPRKLWYPLGGTSSDQIRGNVERFRIKASAFKMMPSKWCHQSSKWCHRNDAIEMMHRNDGIEMMASKWWIRGHRNDAIEMMPSKSGGHLGQFWKMRPCKNIKKALVKQGFEREENPMQKTL